MYVLLSDSDGGVRSAPHVRLVRDDLAQLPLVLDDVTRAQLVHMSGRKSTG
jgi:hypothetical protein